MIPVDIVAGSFDAGIGPKHWAATDMIAVRLSGPMKVAVVGSPKYFERRRPPRTVDDLASHSCIQYRFTTDGATVPWTFERNGRTKRMSLAGRVTVNVPDLAVRAAVDGVGIAYTVESLAAAVPAHWLTGPGSGGRLSLAGNALPVLSRTPAGPGRTAGLHRHGSRTQISAGHAVSQESLPHRLSAPLNS
jgi:DNA-binding transcriptional LysR family regulator